MKFQKFFHFNNKIFAIGAILQMKRRRKFGILTMGGGTPIKIRGVSHPLKGFSRGLGVVKGEGVAAAKKAPPFPLKKEKKPI